jgi:hypothetical protein
VTDYTEGWVSAKPSAWGLSPDRAPGKEQFAIGFEIVEGPDTGKRITWYGGFVSDEATDYTIGTIKKCGWTGSDLSNVELVEEPVRILIEYETYEGKTRAKVKAVGANGGGFKTMDPVQAKSFAAKMANRVKAFDMKHGTGPKPTTGSRPAAQRPSSNGRVPTPPNEYGPAAGADDDIPF